MEEAQVLEELGAVRDAVERLTGLHSRWSGSVVLMDGREIVAMRGQPVLAEKRWSCDILLNTVLTASPTRWRTYIHEMLHSVSVGLNEQDLRRLRGWEEGVVEQVQRLLRPQLLASIGVDVPEEVFAAVDRAWTLNGFVEALEVLRSALEREADTFYLDLLRTPLRERLAYVLAQDHTPEFQRLFARTLGKLR